MNSHQNSFTYSIAVNNQEEMHFSLEKDDSDFSYNQLVLNPLVGTLVKYGMSGKIEPYLAKAWSVSSDSKIWKFEMRDSLYAEDGQKLTADLYVKVLTENLKKYSKSGSAIIFDHLLGWDNFVSGENQFISGIKSSKNSVTFEFDASPGELLEFLRMPYFGLWLEDKGKIISTGPYSLVINKGNEVGLKLREKWFTINSTSLKNIQIRFISLESKLSNIKEREVVRLPFFFKIDHGFQNGYWIESPPTRFESFVLSPTKNNFFNNLNNRKVFTQRIKEKYPELIKSNSFYLSAQSKIKENLENKVYSIVQNAKRITIGLQRTNYSPDELEKFQSLLEHALSGTSIKFDFIHRDLKDKEWLSKTLSNNFFDIRVSSVDIGGYPDFSILKMMFCTKLGVTFPDPSNRICKLVLDGLKTGNVMTQSHINEFNQAVYDDAVIIPIQHHSEKWFVTNDIDPKSLPPTTLYPQFELIRTR